MSIGNATLGGTTITGLGNRMGSIVRGAGGSDRTGRSIVTGNAPSFKLDLISTLVPQIWAGSAVPTYTRASTAYVFGYGPTAVLGVDVPVALLLNSGEAGFVGARRISANNWSAVDANGVPLTTVTPYTDASGPYGYFSGGARADVLGTTDAIRRTMSDVGWVATNMTVATTVGADGGAATGARLTATGANATILFTPGLAGAIRTYSAWVKRITGVGTVSMTVDVADGYVAKTLTAAYAQYQTTSSSAVPVVGFKIATSGDVIDVDFNTLEAATFANPTPIPINVSKAADVDQYVSAGNLPTNNFTIIGESSWPTTPTTANYYLFGSYVDANNSTSVLWDGTNLIARRRIGGASNDATIPFQATGGGTFKWAARFAPAGTDIFVSASKGTSHATGTACQIGANFQVEADGNGAGQPFAETRNFKIYPVALSDGQCIAQTTLGTGLFILTLDGSNLTDLAGNSFITL